MAKFLITLEIPEEILNDQEVKEIFNQYKDLQAEFQVVHQQLESSSKDAMV